MCLCTVVLVLAQSWVGCRWSGECAIDRTGLIIRTHPSTSPHIGAMRSHQGEDLCREHWTTLNGLRTGVGRYRSSMKKWRLTGSAACECGEPEQTAAHIINSCSLHRPPSEAGLFEVGPLTRVWLQHTELTI